jgi:hypothetical protein
VAVLLHSGSSTDFRRLGLDGCNSRLPVPVIEVLGLKINYVSGQGNVACPRGDHRVGDIDASIDAITARLSSPPAEVIFPLTKMPLAKGSVPLIVPLKVIFPPPESIGCC